MVEGIAAPARASRATAARAKKPELGYATDFVTVTMKSILKDVAAQGLRVISNAGGVNPQACAQAIRELAAEQGVSVRIAVVVGDDVTPLLPQLRTEGVSSLDACAADATLPASLCELQTALGAGTSQIGPVSDAARGNFAAFSMVGHSTALAARSVSTINPRVFEIAACGGFQLCDPCRGLETLRLLGAGGLVLLADRGLDGPESAFRHFQRDHPDARARRERHNQCRDQRNRQ